MASNASRENSTPSTLLSYTKDYTELEQSANTINPIILSTFKEVLAACRQNKTTNTDKLKIDSVVDYINEELHMGHWSKVSVATRKAYYASSFIKVFICFFNFNFGGVSAYFHRQLYCCSSMIVQQGYKKL